MGFDKKKKQRKRKNRETKTVLVFDEKARKEYLTGFKKRKDERRKKAQDQVERMIKEERKKLRQKAREFREHTETKHQSIPADIADIAKQEVTDLPEHTVTITDISEIDLAGHGGTRLGLNRLQDSDEDDDDDDQGVDGEINDDETNTAPEISIHKHERDIKKIKNKIHKTAQHLKQKKSKKFKRTLSKKSKHNLKYKNQNMI